MPSKFVYGSGGGIEMPPEIDDSITGLPDPTRHNDKKPHSPMAKPEFLNRLAVEEWRANDPFFSEEGKKSWQRPLNTN